MVDQGKIPVVLQCRGPAVAVNYVINSRSEPLFIVLEISKSL
jgi:hypothetical protein